MQKQARSGSAGMQPAIFALQEARRVQTGRRSKFIVSMPLGVAYLRFWEAKIVEN